MAEDRALPSWAPRLGVGLALAALVGWSFVQRWNVLDASPFPLGIDGYFYPVQLRSLLETGELQYPASPLAFYLLAPFAAVTDPMTGAKLGAAVLGALIALPAYGVGAHLGRDGVDRGRGPGLIAAALATSSAGSMYLTIEFVKNSIGLTVAMTALWLVLRALATPSRRAAGIAVLGIVLAMLTHKMAAGLVLGIAIPAAIVEAHRRDKLRARRALPIAIGVGILGVLLLIGIAMPQRFLSPTDLALIDGLFTSEAEWSLPVLANKLTLGYEPVICAVLSIAAATALIVERNNARTRLLLLAVVLQTTGGLIVLGAAIVREGAISGGFAGGGIAIVVGGTLLWRHASKLSGATMQARTDEARLLSRTGAGRELVAWSMVALGFVIALPWLDVSYGQGLAMRLRIIAFVPMAMCGAIVARAMLRIRWLALPRGPIGAVVAGLVVMLHVGGSRTEGRVLTHPALVSSAAAVKIPDGGVAIVQERHIAYMVAWYARATISMRPEPIAPERRYRVMPLAFIGMGSQLDAELLAARVREQPVVGVHPLHPNGMVVVPEPTWRAVLERIIGPERFRLEAWPTI